MIILFRNTYYPGGTRYSAGIPPSSAKHFWGQSGAPGVKNKWNVEYLPYSPLCTPTHMLIRTTNTNRRAERQSRARQPWAVIIAALMHITTTAPLTGTSVCDIKNSTLGQVECLITGRSFSTERLAGMALRVTFSVPRCFVHRYPNIPPSIHDRTASHTNDICQGWPSLSCGAVS